MVNTAVMATVYPAVTSRAVAAPALAPSARLRPGELGHREGQEADGHGSGQDGQRRGDTGGDRDHPEPEVEVNSRPDVRDRRGGHVGGTELAGLEAVSALAHHVSPSRRLPITWMVHWRPHPRCARGAGARRWRRAGPRASAFGAYRAGPDPAQLTDAARWAPRSVKALRARAIPGGRRGSRAGRRSPRLNTRRALLDPAQDRLGTLQVITPGHPLVPPR